jgi:preprotein translocase subunit Sss1
MSILQRFSGLRRLLSLADRPDKGELWLSIKISLLGLTIVGVIAFFVQLVYALIQMAT